MKVSFSSSLTFAEISPIDRQIARTFPEVQTSVESLPYGLKFRVSGKDSAPAAKVNPLLALLYSAFPGEVPAPIDNTRAKQLLVDIELEELKLEQSLRLDEHQLRQRVQRAINNLRRTRQMLSDVLV